MTDFSYKLLEWYAVHRRELPWRGLDDPYLIWVSEIVLQQTRVEQGWGHYVRFVERFPTIRSLAVATEDEVMKQWQGLGYYARARNMHRAAKIMAESGFPTTYESVRALPGIGPYTAAAICSIAYGLPYPVVDGNVYRVLSRYLAVDEAIDTTSGKHTFARLAAELLPKDKAGLYNQAIMDFGALQCVPRNPQCSTCPQNERCAAYRTSQVADFPVKSRKEQPQDLFLHYIYTRVGDNICLRKRVPQSKDTGFRGSSIWKGLYEPPLILTPQATEADTFLQSTSFRELFASPEEYEQSVCHVVQEGSIHRLSHRVLHLNYYAVQLPAGSQSFTDYIHIALHECADYPVPRPIEKLFQLVLL